MLVMEGSRMVPGRREQDGASQEAIGWCQPEGNRMVPGRLRTPGSSAPEPGACGRETAAQKDQTLQMFLSRVPVRAERKTSEVLTLEGGRILQAGTHSGRAAPQGHIWRVSER